MKAMSLVAILWLQLSIAFAGGTEGGNGGDGFAFGLASQIQQWSETARRPEVQAAFPAGVLDRFGREVFDVEVVSQRRWARATRGCEPFGLAEVVLCSMRGSGLPRVLVHADTLGNFVVNLDAFGSVASFTHAKLLGAALAFRMAGVESSEAAWALARALDSARLGFLFYARLPYCLGFRRIVVGGCYGGRPEFSGGPIPPLRCSSGYQENAYTVSSFPLELLQGQRRLNGLSVQCSERPLSTAPALPALQDVIRRSILRFQWELSFGAGPVRVAEIALSMFNRMNLIPDFETQGFGFTREDFARAVLETRIEVASQPLGGIRCAGASRSACNYPSEKRIRFDAGAIQDPLSFTSWGLVLHEYLGILGVDDSGYLLSNRILSRSVADYPILLSSVQLSPERI